MAYEESGGRDRDSSHHCWCSVLLLKSAGRPWGVLSYTHVQVSTSYINRSLQGQDLPFCLGDAFQWVKESSYPSATTPGSFPSWWCWSSDYELILHAQFCLKKGRELEIFPLTSRKLEFDDIRRAASQIQKYFPSPLSWPSFSKLSSLLHHACTHFHSAKHKSINPTKGSCPQHSSSTD